MSTDLRLFVTTPKGMEPLLAKELRTFGATALKPARAGIGLDAPLALAYRICLWSRLANRVLLTLAHFPAPDPEALYDHIHALEWEDHLSPDATLAVDCHVADSAITHNQYAAQKAKDAIVDRLRTRFGRRPSVERYHPDVRINIYIQSDRATLSLDLSGESLHRRGYRTQDTGAPLKENLAAALLIAAGWPTLATEDGALIDPLCGSGTLPIEAALIAADWAPGLNRSYFGFTGWLGHVPAHWHRLREEAQARRSAGLAHLPPIAGRDHDPHAVDIARANAARAGLAEHLHFEVGDLSEARPIAARGLLIVNPPYGERMGEAARLTPLYALLGQVLHTHFGGWRAAVFTANPEATRGLGMPVKRQFTLYNGTLACRLSTHAVPTDIPSRLDTTVAHTAKRTAMPSTSDEYKAIALETTYAPPPAPPSPWPTTVVPTQPSGMAPNPSPAAPAGTRASSPPPAAHRSEGAAMFANRLRKNLRHLGRWARRQGVTCYRVYDADLPDYALAVDLYQGEPPRQSAPDTAPGRWLHVQEYQAPASIDPARAEARLSEALAILAEELAIPLAQIYFKVRKRQKGAAQYTRQGTQRVFHIVHEGALRFLVNFGDYLDTGLFLDHRPTRVLIGELAPGHDVLNLFCYTGSATVHAAAGGARSTTSIDLSRTYLDWTQRNLLLNHFTGPEHRRIQTDCLQWLEQAHTQPQRYGLIFLDPPSFSNSKRMETSFDIQRDQATVLDQALRLLTPDGVLIFSTNRRQFKLDPAMTARLGQTDLHIEDLTRATLPRDFERGTPIHRCWRIHRATPPP